MTSGRRANGIAAFAVEEGNQTPKSELLFRFYLWHTVDMLPFVDLWEVYDVKPAIQPDDFVARSLVLAFRTAIVGLAITVLANWIRVNREANASDQRRNDAATIDRAAGSS